MKRSWLTAALAVTTLAVVAFLNGLGGEFVLDDHAFLVGNAQLVNDHTLAYFFTENLWYYSIIPDAYSASYRPLYFLTLWISNQLSVASPFTLHLFNLQIHTLATLLLLFTIRRMVPDISPLAAGMAVGLFAVHPVHSEAVAWVSAFVHPLATVFLLAAYLAHDFSRHGGGVKTTVLSLGFLTLALLSNEMAIAFPFFILLHDRVRYGRLLFAKNLPYFVLLALYMLIRKLVLGEPIPMTFSDLDLWLRLPVFLLEYTRHLLMPWPQPLYLQMPDNWSVSMGAWVIAALYIAAWVGLWRVPPKDRYVPLVAFIWIAIFLLPPMAAAFSPDARFALRSLYLPSVGIAVLFAWTFDMLPLFRRPVGITLITITLMVALAGTVTANRHWKDDGMVYGQVITWNPDHFAGYLGLGKYYEQRNETEQALAQYERSISLAGPTEKSDPMEQLARLLGETGKNKDSLELFKQLTVLKPHSASVWTGLGNNLWALGQLEVAADAYLRAHNAEPDNWITCYNLVLVFNQLGRADEAAQYVKCSQQP